LLLYWLKSTNTDAAHKLQMAANSSINATGTTLAIRRMLTYADVLADVCLQVTANSSISATGTTLAIPLRCYG